MSRITDLQRMEFINTLERLYGGVLARQELQVPALIEVLFQQRYDLDSPRDAGILISNLDTKINTDLKEELFDYIGNGMKQLTGIGVTHSIANSLNIMGDSAFDFLGIDQRLALDYINRVGTDGMRLSDRIWGTTEKEAITKEVYRAVESGDNAYKLAENIGKVVTEGTPRSSLTRIAKTELNYAYSHAKADTIIAEADYLPNAEAYIKVSLSPAHRIYDICDTMQGTYRASEAPLPSFHPNCFTEDTLTFGTGVSAKFVSRMDGDIMDITTEKGTKLSVTPNHPMLSVNGFVSANVLKKGDYLISTGSRFETLISIKPDSKPVKSLIKDVIIPDSVVVSTVPTSVDFHSDGVFYKKVNIILSNSKLLNNTKTFVSKFFNNSKFVSRLVGFINCVVLGSLYKFILSTLLTSNSIMSILGDLPTPVFGFKLINRLLSFAMTSYLNIISQEDIPNCVPTDFKFLMKGKLRDTSVIFPDKIVDIKIRHFKGKVYNLETAGHWYTANSIIAHNCLCRTETFLKVSGTQGRVDTLTRSLQSYRSEHGGKTPIKTIETYNKVVSI